MKKSPLLGLSAFALSLLALIGCNAKGASSESQSETVTQTSLASPEEKPNSTVPAKCSGLDVFLPHKLTIVKNDGSELETELYSGAEIAERVTIERDGYTFGGLYSDEKLTQEIKTMPSSDSKAYVWWKEETKTSSFNYVPNQDGGVTITKFVGFETSVTTPSFIAGKPVTEIGEGAFYNEAQMKELRIGHNVTKIGDHAFANCWELEHFYLPNTVADIGKEAFLDCAELKDMVLSRGLVRINDYAFSGCDQVDNVFYAGSMEEWQNITISDVENANKRLFAWVSYYSEKDPEDRKHVYWHYVSGTPTTWFEIYR